MRVLAVALAVVVGAGCGGDSSVSSGGVTSKAVVQRFAAAGLEAGSPRAMTAQDFGIAPMKTDDATRFLIPSLGSDSGGRAFVFDDLGDLAETKQVYDDAGKESGLLFSWTFANEDRGVLVQINGDLPKRKANRYRDVIADL